jgi:hypothetical protein
VNKRRDEPENVAATMADDLIDTVVSGWCVRYFVTALVV